jgi:hypothetical protein
LTGELTLPEIVLFQNFKMKKLYTIIFIIAIVVLTVLSVISLNKLGSSEATIEEISSWLNLLSGLFGYFSFGFTSILLIFAHFIIYKRKAPGFQKYLFIGLPYLLFIVYTIISYVYIYELYNVFQERTGQVIDTPDMDVLGLNLSLFAFIMGGINLAVLKIFGRE